MAKLLVFAKAPRLGLVKTRLQPALSQQQSVDLHEQMLWYTLTMALNAGIAEVELWLDQPNQYWQAWCEERSVRVYLQCGNSLGERMLRGFQQALQSDELAVVIGCDCPFINAGYLQQAFAALAGGLDAVMGPAEDGGYVLLGLRRAEARLFNDVNWGTSRVLVQTYTNLAAMGWHYTNLATLADIDRPEDLQLLCSVPELAIWAHC
jgi:rSAM/selenodomain-associated transferase 1